MYLLVANLRFSLKLMWSWSPGGWVDPGLGLFLHQSSGAEHRGPRVGLDLHRALPQQQAVRRAVLGAGVEPG